MTSGVTVLVADDEPDLRVLTHSLLEAAGFEVVEEAVDGEAALAAIELLHPPPVPTVLVLDYLMPGLSGLDVAERVLEHHPDQRIVLFTAYPTPRCRGEPTPSVCAACRSPNSPTWRTWSQPSPLQRRERSRAAVS